MTKSTDVRGLLATLAVLFISAFSPAVAQGDAAAAKVIGPEGGDNSCSNCHAKETEAWSKTHHYSTYAERHRSDRAKEILKALGERSMKRSGQCVQCHYTSVLEAGEATVKWGVSCESCHGGAAEWNDVHNKVGGARTGQTMKWGDGKTEAAGARATRLGAAEKAGMIHSAMTYEIATNCFGCHTVPDEDLVNKGGHRPGSDFDLAEWSQGEVRHNFVSSPGAPDQPTNRPAAPAQLRRLYVVGAMVDLEVSLRNLANVKEPGGAFHKAMVSRVAGARAKVETVLAKVQVPGLATALGAVPSPVDAQTKIPASLPDALRAATKEFAASTADLTAIDGLIPKTFKGDAQP